MFATGCLKHAVDTPLLVVQHVQKLPGTGFALLVNSSCPIALSSMAYLQPPIRKWSLLEYTPWPVNAGMCIDCSKRACSILAMRNVIDPCRISLLLLQMQSVAGLKPQQQDTTIPMVYNTQTIQAAAYNQNQQLTMQPTGCGSKLCQGFTKHHAANSQYTVPTLFLTSQLPSQTQPAIVTNTTNPGKHVTHT
jgi:hypothetical protein